MNYQNYYAFGHAGNLNSLPPSCKFTAEIAHFSVAALLVLAVAIFNYPVSRALAIGVFAFAWIKEIAFDYALGDDTLLWALIDALFYTAGAVVGLILARFVS